MTFAMSRRRSPAELEARVWCARMTTEQKKADVTVDLVAENAELRSRVATLESELRRREIQAEADRARSRRPKPRRLDAGASDRFRRPWDGR
jgi:hypothetical protein